MESLAPKYGSQRYNQACYLALAVPVCAPSERERIGTQAVNALRQALEAGYSREDAAHDSDFDAVRHRADFKELLAGGGG